MLLMLALAIGVIFACGLYLMLRRNLLRLVIGLSLLAYGVNLLLFAAGDLSRRGAPIVGVTPVEQMADPLPQALILTSIVISFGVLAFTLALSYRASQAAESDDLDAVEDMEGQES